MPATAGVFSPGDAYRILEQAYDNPPGIRIECASRNEAIALRHRLNYYRKQDRLRSKIERTPDHPQYEKSVYDILELRVEDNVVDISHRTALEFKITLKEPKSTEVPTND